MGGGSRPRLRGWPGGTREVASADLAATNQDIRTVRTVWTVLILGPPSGAIRTVRSAIRTVRSAIRTVLGRSIRTVLGRFFSVADEGLGGWRRLAGWPAGQPRWSRLWAGYLRRPHPTLGDQAGHQDGLGRSGRSGSPGGPAYGRPQATTPNLRRPQDGSGRLGRYGPS